MSRRFQFSDYCVPIAAFFLIVAAIDATEPVADCVVQSPRWAIWLCAAFGFGGAGLSRKPLRGALTGLGIALVPAAMAGLFDGVAEIVGLAPLLAILAVLALNAIRETIRGQ
ncbi:MAG TPA: hypothetical protein VG125_13670 [Pirellulales bacterium]|jgi:hypothetical protein|nr:hypothetical protein [Pirellulales bacterium]